MFRNDLAWDGESKRIIAVGDGRERQGHIFISNDSPKSFYVWLIRVVVRFGHVFAMDTGSSAGEIIGHSKV